MQRHPSHPQSPSTARCTPRPHGAFVARAWAALGAGLALSTTAAAQGGPELTFSIDFSGPTINRPGDATGRPITDGDLLVRTGGLFTPAGPQITFPAIFLDRYDACEGHMPGVTCGLEVNAISFGRDARLRPNPAYRFNVLFSVDEFSRGRQGAAGSSADVFSESAGAEASTDLYFSSLVGAGPFTAQANRAYADGDGNRVQQGAASVFGLGLVEPTIPEPSTLDSGDNIDAVEYGEAFQASSDRLFFSLESGRARCFEQGSSFDSAGNQVVLGSATPASSADVLVWSAALGGVAVYASAAELGLDQFQVSEDDIDALMVFENGQFGYTPPVNLYDWNSSQGSDLILFSVRCGSNIVGQIDPVTNRAISEGDILIKLDNGSLLPQVFIPAEALGLRSTAAGDLVNDELNALDIFDDAEEPFKDCNENGIEDALDISDMNSNDVDNNGIPDECEDDWSSVCDCTLASSAPCGNTSTADRGCRNVTGVGGRLEGGGTTSTFSDSLLLLCSDLPPGGFGVAFAGLTPVNLPFQNGIRCLAASGPRLGDAAPVDAMGNLVKGPGLIGGSPMTLTVMSGSSYLFQVFYRDSGGPCGGFINTTNALSVVFTP